MKAEEAGRMDLESFKDTLDAEAPPPGLSEALKGLWHEAKGDWEAAHHCAQRQGDETGAWVHAYLHRVEGDLSNAGYWYRRAGKPASDAPLAEEWREIVTALL